MLAHVREQFVVRAVLVDEERHVAGGRYGAGPAVRGGRVRAEGELDFRGTLAVDRDAPVGFRLIRLHFDLGEHQALKSPPPVTATG